MFIFPIFFKIKVCYVYSLESPQGDSNEYTQNTIFQKKKKKKKKKINSSKTVLNLKLGMFKGHKKEFKIAVVNEPSGFEPLKLYRNLISEREREREGWKY